MSRVAGAQNLLLDIVDVSRASERYCFVSDVHVFCVNRLEVHALAAKQNITVAIEPALLKKARAIAARRGLSVSALLAEEIRDLVAEDARYSVAQRRALALLEAPLALGTGPLDREALHERRRIR